ncbi:MAG: hypothetical protein AAGC92_07885 [Pseudomonadota bacterium]
MQPTLKRLSALVLVLPLVGCGTNVQMSSGVEYLAEYEHPVMPPDVAQTSRHTDEAYRPLTVDQEVVMVASIEPQLKIPGRFGLARIHRGQLTAIPEEEAALWRELVVKHSELGTFVPISPMIAMLASSSVRTLAGGNVVRQIRLGAARQHVDTVLVYEIGARSAKRNTFLVVADLTIIGGAILPTRSVSAEGIAQALLLDVRNGYPYGTAQAVADLSRLSPSFGSDAVREQLVGEAMLLTVEKLVPEIDTMIGKLIAAVLVQRKR